MNINLVHQPVAFIGNVISAVELFPLQFTGLSAYNVHKSGFHVVMAHINSLRPRDAYMRQ